MHIYVWAVVYVCSMCVYMCVVCVYVAVCMLNESDIYSKCTHYFCYFSKNKVHFVLHCGRSANKDLLNHQFFREWCVLFAVCLLAVLKRAAHKNNFRCVNMFKWSMGEMRSTFFFFCWLGDLGP